MGQPDIVYKRGSLPEGAFGRASAQLYDYIAGDTMKRLMPSKYRYPLFFLGIMIIDVSGFLYKYLHATLLQTEISVVIGFFLFLASIVL